MSTASDFVYHLARAAEWRASSGGEYRGSEEDRRDGFLHFSTREQIAASAALHRAGERDLVLLRARTEALGDALRWEPSRGGTLFPHLYGALPLSAVEAADALPVDQNGVHVFPELP
jgi:uncharacterized protein (DUF952 family)